MDKKKLRKYLAIAKKAALSAGDFLVKHGASGKKTVASTRWDTKLVADKQSEKKVIAFLRKNSNFSILSEEIGGIKGSGEYVWVIDPLDGTVNYSRGLPICCVSIGLMKGAQPVLGVVYDFNRKELFSGVAGEGAWLNGKKIIVSIVNKQENSILCTGFPVNSDFSDKKLLQFCQNIQRFKKVRLIGSAALSLCYVACGRVDAYREDNIMLWDIAAGVAIAQAAGGNALMAHGSKDNAYNVLVSNGKFKF
jgi:myo-inositol-1(or 4)-monophosphatase